MEAYEYNLVNCNIFIHNFVDFLVFIEQLITPGRGFLL